MQLFNFKCVTSVTVGRKNKFCDNHLALTSCICGLTYLLYFCLFYSGLFLRLLSFYCSVNYFPASLLLCGLFFIRFVCFPFLSFSLFPALALVYFMLVKKTCQRRTRKNLCSDHLAFCSYHCVS